MSYGQTVLMVQRGETIREDKDWAAYLAQFDEIDPSQTWGRREWAGSGSLGETLAIARTGWPEGKAYVRDVAMPAVGASLPLPSDEGWGYDVTGANYDVGEYLAGVPECWLAPVTHGTKPTIRMLVNITVSAGVPVEAINMRGAAVAALALRLQAAGYAIELWSTWGIRSEVTRWSRVLLSDPHGGPLDTDRIMFGLAHPAAGRHLGHFLTDSGTPIDNPPWKDVDLYLPCMHLYKLNDWHDAAAITRWIEETYNRITTEKE